MLEGKRLSKTLCCIALANNYPLATSPIWTQIHIYIEQRLRLLYALNRYQFSLGRIVIAFSLLTPFWSKLQLLLVNFHFYLCPSRAPPLLDLNISFL
jgi:hypothetical protein